MADQSNIAWTKSTFNPWIGCTKIGPGCDGCYAEALDNRMQYGGGKHWGDGVPRYRTKPATWAKPLAWNKAAPESEFAGRKGFWPVFCASLADVFDNQVPEEWRIDLWRLIDETPNLSWLLVTKRIGNVARMVPGRWIGIGFPGNVRILITVVNQEEADRDIPKLLALPCKNGISYEPALGPIDFSVVRRPPSADDIALNGKERIKDYFVDALTGTNGVLMHDGRVLLEPFSRRQLDWIIVGGESDQPGHKARPFVHGWARDTIRQCAEFAVPVFVKQMGSNATNREGVLHPYKDRAGADPAEWPEDLRVREFPL